MFGGFGRKRECCCSAGQCPGGALLSLANAQTGKRMKVTQICGGRCLCARMAALGIYPGTELELLCAGCGAPCLVKVNGGTLSLGDGVSRKILVTPVG
jgi:ferrous iron transport protein A